MSEPAEPKSAGILSYRKWQAMKLPADRRRVLSGVQPSGKLHIGNYFGALLPLIDSIRRSCN